MRPYLLALLSVLCFVAVGQEKSTSPAGDLPKDIEAQEQYVLLSAKVKSLAEVQDLVLKQQQLILQNLEKLRGDLDALKTNQSSGVTRADLQACLARLDQVQSQVQSLRESNVLARIAQELPPRTAAAEPRTNADTNVIRGFRFEPYKVLPGDTLSKIVIRVNDMLDRRNMARVSQEQIEHSNPGLSPDKIRVGQTILIPLLDKP